MTTQTTLSIEDQELLLTRSNTLDDLTQNIKSTPVFAISDTENNDKFIKVYIGSKDSDVVDGFSMCFCSSCEHEYEESEDLCTNTDCETVQDDDQDDDF